MLYDQYFIDDLKNRADIVRIIQPYAQDLKKKGANWMACCPFHQEKTPSFSVSPSKGFYKCFGCGKGGNVYTFLMEMEGVNFPEAIKRVAELGLQGIEFYGDGIEQYRPNPKELEKLMDAAGITFIGASNGEKGQSTNFIDVDQIPKTMADHIAFCRDFLQQLGCDHWKVNMGARPAGDQGECQNDPGDARRG